jgi:ABC-2 type transport system permease protein
MGVYLAVARQSFRRQSTYRAAMVAGVFTNAVFGVILASVLLAAYGGRDEINGLTPSGAVTITFIAQGLLLVTGAFGWLELTDRVRTGDVATDLQRPVDFSAYWMAMFVGASGFSVIGRGIPPFLVGGIVFDLQLPTSAATWVGFALTVAGAAFVASRWWFLVSLSAFWLVGDARGVIQMAVAIQLFASGTAIPLQFFPDALGNLLLLTPFAAMAQLPAQAFLGQTSALVVLGSQLAWSIALHGAGLLVLRRATKKLVIDGG